MLHLDAVSITVRRVVMKIQREKSTSGLPLLTDNSYLISITNWFGVYPSMSTDAGRSNLSTRCVE